MMLVVARYLAWSGSREESKIGHKIYGVIAA
jgi:hypothetical protein